VFLSQHMLGRPEQGRALDSLDYRGTRDNPISSAITPRAEKTDAPRIPSLQCDPWSDLTLAIFRQKYENSHRTNWVGSRSVRKGRDGYAAIFDPPLPGPTPIVAAGRANVAIPLFGLTFYVFICIHQEYKSKGVFYEGNNRSY
jgi:hypothetical protein